MAGTYQEAGQLLEAIALYAKVRDAAIVKLGPDHPSTLFTLNNLAVAYQAGGKTAEAIALFEKVRDAIIIKLGPDHPNTLTTLNNLAGAYQVAGKTAEAIALWVRVLPRARLVFGATHPNTIKTTTHLINALEQASQSPRPSSCGGGYCPTMTSGWPVLWPLTDGSCSRPISPPRLSRSCVRFGHPRRRNRRLDDLQCQIAPRRQLACPEEIR